MADFTKAELERLERELQAEKDKTLTRRKLAEATEKLAEAERQLANDRAYVAEQEASLTGINEVRVEAAKRSIAIQERIIEDTKLSIEANEEARVQIRNLGEEIKEVNRLRRLNNEDIRDEIDALKASIVTRQAAIDTEEDGNEKLEKRIKLQKEKAQLAQKQLTLDEKTNNLSAVERRNARKAQKDATAEGQRLEKLQDLIENTGEQGRIAQEGISGLLGSLARGDVKGALGNTKKLTSLFSDLTEGGMSAGAALKSVGAALAKSVGAAAFAAFFAAPGLALLKITKESLALVVQLSDLEKSVMKATGGSKQFASAMTESFMETRRFAGTAEEAAKAQTSLSQTFTDFTQLNSSTQVELIKTSALLQRLGVDAGAVSKNTQLMVKSLGMTAGEAAKANLRLAALGEDLQIDPAQLAKDFGSAGGQLAKLGSEGEAAFKRLAVASKVTGLEIGKILNMVEKFDTFEGAATQAGKLNAALGGNFVNAMELMTATDPVERFNMIRDSILDAGLSFDEMSYYQRKFYTEAAGLSDVSELAMMMSGDMDSLSGDVGKTSADYKRMADRAKELASFQDLLRSSFQQLIPVLTPVVEKFTELTLSFFEYMSENGPSILSGLKTAAGVLALLGGVAAAVLAAMNAPILAIGAAVGAAISAIGFLATLLFDTAFNPPSFFQGMKEMSADFDGMSVNINKSTKTMHSFGNEVVATGNKTYRQTQMTRKAMPEVMQMTNTSMTNEINKNQINNAMLGSSTATTNAMSTMTSNAVSSAISNSANNTTVNNNQQGGATGINIKFDNKKFADLFDVQVEKSIGRATRKAVI